MIDDMITQSDANDVSEDDDDDEDDLNAYERGKRLAKSIGEFMSNYLIIKKRKSSHLRLVIELWLSNKCR